MNEEIARAATPFALREVKFFYDHLVTEAQRLPPNPEIVVFYLHAFLSASDNLRELLSHQGFKHSDWDNEQERALMSDMKEQRRYVVHFGGAKTKLATLSIPISALPPGSFRGFHGSTNDGEPVLDLHGHSFEGDDISVVSRCTEYVELLKKLVQRFSLS
jgi:hypothetical protein